MVDVVRSRDMLRKAVVRNVLRRPVLSNGTPRLRSDGCKTREAPRKPQIAPPAAGNTVW